MPGRNLLHCIRYLVGLAPAQTQTTEAERTLLARYARGRRSLVELGVMHGVNTGLIRSVMADDGVVTGVDPHPRGRLGVSLERLIASRELSRFRRGRAELRRQFSFEAAAEWHTPIDFLFIDGDHSWNGIDRDWHDWAGKVTANGVVALHDTRPVPWRPDHDSVRYYSEVIARDPRFREVDSADSLTILERVA